MQRTTPFCDLETYACETVVVGSGASGLSAFDALLDGGEDRVLLITEDVMGGTSRNTGSDKQTYYKLTLSGSDGDSVRSLARDLYNGGCVDGDLALCEAALSAQGFLKLVQLGVPFPRNRWGEYIGYKTDHDPHRRATSAGPYTSRFMTEALHKSVQAKGGTIVDQSQVVRILTDEGAVRGLLCLDVERFRLFVVWCRYLVWATGGPAAMYSNSVYPESQYGASGLAFEAGCLGQNLTEWQYGLASVSPRWNVSGTYMQALPRFFSVDSTGKEYDFLSNRITNAGQLLSFIFLKGYQWPFDVAKIQRGSSIIDLLVHEELGKGRRIFLDYRTNPIDGAIDYEGLAPEAFEYLSSAKATFGLPIDRLRLMNEPAYQFYLDHGIDLATEPLEISLSAQHNNGGIAVDCWYRTAVDGLFAIGEAAGTHGVVRPGGSALNAGQAGAARVAVYILSMREKCGPFEPKLCRVELVEEMIALIEAVIGEEDTVRPLFRERQQKMSRYASAVRNPHQIASLRAEGERLLSSLSSLTINRATRLPHLFRLRDMLISQVVYLYAIEEYCKTNGKSRGSALYLKDGGERIHPTLPEEYRTEYDQVSPSSPIQMVRYEDKVLSAHWRAARPIPEEDDFFENVWREFRANGNVY